MHVTFCEYLVFYECRRNLYITLAKYLKNTHATTWKKQVWDTVLIKALIKKTREADERVCINLYSDSDRYLGKTSEREQWNRIEFCIESYMVLEASEGKGM